MAHTPRPLYTNNLENSLCCCQYVFSSGKTLKKYVTHRLIRWNYGMMEQTAHRLSSFWTQFSDNYLYGSRDNKKSKTRQKQMRLLQIFFRQCCWSWSIETFCLENIHLYIATWNHMNIGIVKPVLSGHLKGTAWMKVILAVMYTTWAVVIYLELT